MSGIVALLRHDGAPLGADEGRAVFHALDHRGPDGSSLLVDRSWLEATPPTAFAHDDVLPVVAWPCLCFELWRRRRVGEHGPSTAVADSRHASSSPAPRRWNGVYLPVVSLR